MWAVLTTVLISTAGNGYCFDEAEKLYNLPHGIVRAISAVESNHNPQALNCGNKGGSCDVGHMQINSMWAEEIGMPSWNKLYDPCHASKVGAYVLATCFSKKSGWDAVECYGPKAKRGGEYARRVYRAWIRFAPPPWPAP